MKECESLRVRGSGRVFSFYENDYQDDADDEDDDNDDDDADDDDEA